MVKALLEHGAHVNKQNNVSACILLLLILQQLIIVIIEKNTGPVGQYAVNGNMLE